MRLIIAGPRQWYVHSDVIEHILDRYNLVPTELVNGMATGVDQSAREWREELHPECLLAAFPALWESWEELGLPSREAAGPYRNGLMADYADELLILKRRGKFSPGTKSMLVKMLAASKPVHIWTPQ